MNFPCRHDLGINARLEATNLVDDGFLGIETIEGSEARIALELIDGDDITHDDDDREIALAGDEKGGRAMMNSIVVIGHHLNRIVHGDCELSFNYLKTTAYTAKHGGTC